MWIQKYKPKKLNEVVVGMKLMECIRNYNWKKPLLLYGGIGVGKTILAEMIAKEFNYELVEITNKNMSKARIIANTLSVFGTKKLILIDQVEKIRDIKEVTELVKGAKNPTILITTDFRNKRLMTIKRYCEPLQIRKPHAATIAKILQRICTEEGINADKQLLVKIASNANGDIRSAINDLETIGKGKKELKESDLNELHPRDKSVDIFRALSSILGARDLKTPVKVMMDLDEQPRDILLWIDENMPRRYNNEELDSAYYYLSRADIFIGRIINRQYWGFLRYASTLMSGGVALSKGDKPHKHEMYQYPGYIRHMARTRKERKLKQTIGEKLSPFLHTSTKIIAQEYIPLFGIFLKNKKVTTKELESRFGFDSDELKYLAK